MSRSLGVSAPAILLHQRKPTRQGSQCQLNIHSAGLARLPPPIAFPDSPSPAHVRPAPGRPGRASGVAMQLLRHSQIAMTMEAYSEVPTTKTRSAHERLGTQLDG